MDETGYRKICNYLVEYNSSKEDCDNAINITKQCLTCDNNHPNADNYRHAASEVQYWSTARDTILPLDDNDKIKSVILQYTSLPKTHIGQCMLKCFQNTCTKKMPGKTISEKKSALYTILVDLKNPTQVILPVTPEI